MNNNRMGNTEGVTKALRKRRGRYAVIVANSPGPRKHSYQEFLEKYRALKVAGKIKGSRIKLPIDEMSSEVSSIPMRGQFTAEEISRAIDKVKGRRRKLGAQLLYQLPVRCRLSPAFPRNGIYLGVLSVPVALRLGTR